MCVIAIRPKGVEFDDKCREWIINCAASNPDGAGVMYSDGEQVHWHKGFMGENAAEKTIEYIEKIPSENQMVLHYRIGTHGKKDEGTTHPFPLWCGDDAVKETEGIAPAVLMHNGIISQMPHKSDFSDTQQLVQYLNKIPELNLSQLPYILSLTDGGLYAVLAPNRLITVGDFEEEENGWMFSNNSYLGLRKRAKGGYYGAQTFHSGYYGMGDYSPHTAKALTAPKSHKSNEVVPTTATDKTYDTDVCVVCEKKFKLDTMYEDNYGDVICDGCVKEFNFVEGSDVVSVEDDNDASEKPWFIKNKENTEEVVVTP